MSTPVYAGLPDLFQFQNGRHLTQPSDWPARRRELLDLILDVEYGGIPPAPRQVLADELITHQSASLGNARHSQYRLNMEGGLSFVLDLLVPVGEKPFPVIIDGDTCWGPISDEIKQAVLQRGYALATFNRTEIAPDLPNAGRSTAIYRVFLNGEYGALSAWAWGYSRCIDFLLTQDFINPAQITITGHSRGGKATLLAGAVDERIALTVPNDSGCGGAGSYYRQGSNSETLTDIIQRFPYWFGPKLHQYVGREQQLPFDQHGLKALVAPRALLTTEAFDDLWANPSGSWITHQAARSVFSWLGAEDQLGIWYRPGGHSHSLIDWQALLAFADWKFRGLTPDRSFDPHPFPDLR